MEFKDKVAVITGAASGIGRSIALAFAKLGSDIVIADIDDKSMKAVSLEIEKIGRRAITVHCDVSSDTDVNSLASKSISTFHKVDILVNNAGISVEGYMQQISMKDWQRVFAINLFGIIRGVNAFLDQMLKNGSGYIINTSSMGGLAINWGPPSLAALNIPYITSKFGIVGLSEALHAYLSPRGIMVSVLCPGPVDTNITSNIQRSGNSKEIDQIKAGIPAPYLLKPDDVAKIVVEGMNDGRFLMLTNPELEKYVIDHGKYMMELRRKQ